MPAPCAAYCILRTASGYFLFLRPVAFLAAFRLLLGLAAFLAARFLRLAITPPSEGLETHIPPLRSALLLAGATAVSHTGYDARLHGVRHRAKVEVTDEQRRNHRRPAEPAGLRSDDTYRSAHPDDVL